MTAPDQPLSPVMRDLQNLIHSGGWTNLAGPADVLIFIHPWPDGSVDALAMWSEERALAERTNPRGEPVWRREGTLAETLAALRDLPASDAPNAPRLVIDTSRTARLWTPE